MRPIRSSLVTPSRASFTDLKVGDQLRALGDRTEDPLRFNPQKVVTGSFRTVGGVVTAVDPATGEIKINELEKKTPLTIVIKQDAVLRRFPREMGAMVVWRRPGGGGGAAGGGAQPQQAHSRKVHRVQVVPAVVDRRSRPVADSISTTCSKDCQLFRSRMLRLATLSSFPVRRVWIRSRLTAFR